MRTFRTLTLFLILCLTACAGGRSGAIATPVGGAVCGDGFCTGDENFASCTQDCPASTFLGEVKTVYIESEGISRIAVIVAIPQAARYEEGAGIIVIVPPVFTSPEGFTTDPDATSLGLIQVSFLWPGQSDPGRGVESEGQFDYAGSGSLQVLRDVVRFAAGRAPDSRGRYITAISNKIQPLTEEVGIYAFSDAGLAAVGALSIYSIQMQGLQYYIGRENPTVDTITCLEIGYRGDSGDPLYNPFYAYPSAFSPAGITLNYTSLRWDPTYTWMGAAASPQQISSSAGASPSWTASAIIPPHSPRPCSPAARSPRRIGLATWPPRRRRRRPGRPARAHPTCSLHCAPPTRT
jgi:hypothetical protein